MRAVAAGEPMRMGVERGEEHLGAGPMSPPPCPLPMLTLSLPRVARATCQPPLTGADHVVIGDEHVGQEHLVELRAPVVIRSGRTSTPGCLHVDRPWW